MIFWIYRMKKKKKTTRISRFTSETRSISTMKSASLSFFMTYFPSCSGPSTKCDLEYFSETLPLPSVSPFPQTRGSTAFVFPLLYKRQQGGGGGAGEQGEYFNGGIWPAGLISSLLLLWKWKAHKSTGGLMAGH